MSGPESIRCAADVGGTFTDVLGVDRDGVVRLRKVLSTPEDYSIGVADGVQSILQRGGDGGLTEFLHATTVATNAMLQRAGARTGLITTAGFRDVLELRRMRFPDTYNLQWTKPPPLVERYMRLEVDERMAADGSVVRPIRASEVQSVLKRLVEKEGAESIAVCLINSYLNPKHERLIGDVARRLYPRLPLSLSVEVLPEMKEYERTSTTVANAYVAPLVSAYLSRLKARLGEIGFHGDVTVMQSNGGLMSSDTAIQRPVHLLESGPAAGVVAAASIATRLGLGDVVTLDIGGTTAKSALVEKGRPALASEYEVGAPISIASRVIKGGGYVLSTPVIDLAEVGAGGGSIVYTDSAGGLHVGPRSAGASPGPVCYGRGGVEATLTDADVVMGLLPGSGLAGGEIPIDVVAARRAVAAIARFHRLALLEMAHGISELADAAMSRAVRAVSVSRGHDVRKATMIAFGGNGPVHAAAVATRLGIRHVLIPNAPGLFSAIGLVEAVVERHAAATVRVLLNGRSADTQIARLFDRLDSETVQAVGSHRTRAVALRRFADLRYQGQSAILQLAVPASGANQLIPKIAEAFHSAHESIYGHRFSDRPVEVVSIRSVASVAARGVSLKFGASPPGRRRGRRPVYFGRALGVLDAPVLARSELSSRRRVKGPLLIDEYDSTTVVPPGASVLLDRDGNIRMDLESRGV